MEEMVINYWVVLAGGVAAMIVGFLWYGPLFGKKWLSVMHVSPEDLERRQAMQKTAGPLYAIQFLLTLLQVYILAHFVQAWGEGSGIETAVWLWLGFVMPTLAASAMWNNLETRQKWTLFGLTAGYQLVIFVLFGYLLQVWG